MRGPLLILILSLLGWLVFLSLGFYALDHFVWGLA